MSAAAVKKSDDKRSDGVRVKEMPWGRALFPGCRIKTPLFDPNGGLTTVLMKMKPGATLPDREHVLLGSLIDKEGPEENLEIKAGDHVWRPAGSGHSAWRPDGGESLAMFQVANIFLKWTAACSTPPAKTGIQSGAMC